MKKEKKIRVRAILAAVLTMTAVTACGRASTYHDASAGAPAATEEIAYESAAYDAGMAAEEEYAYDTTAEAAPASEGGYESSTVTEAEAAKARKLIKTVNISAETEAFDTLVPGLQKQVEALGGYIESISVYDVDTYYVEDSLRKRRCANLTARVPKEKLDGFLAQVGEETNVTSRSESVEDVTLQYVDLESHKKALLTEQERLLALMEQAESVEDIIAIEGRLSEVRYQLESMESQLRTYDNQIDYSTVYLSIDEVRSYSAPQTATVWQRIQRGFVKSLSDIGFGIRDMAIGFVIDLPYIILGLLAIVIVCFVLRFCLKRFLRSRFWAKTLEKGRNLRLIRMGGGRKKEAGTEEENGKEQE